MGQAPPHPAISPLLLPDNGRDGSDIGTAHDIFSLMFCKNHRGCIDLYSAVLSGASLVEKPSV